MKINQEDTQRVWEACIDARWVVLAYSNTARIFFGKEIPRL
jgi:hypothetical protein